MISRDVPKHHRSGVKPFRNIPAVHQNRAGVRFRSSTRRRNDIGVSLGSYSPLPCADRFAHPNLCAEPRSLGAALCL